MNSGPRSPPSISSSSPSIHRQRLSKDLSVSDLSVTPQKPFVYPEHREKTDQKTPFSQARIKKLKEHFITSKTTAGAKVDGAVDDRDSVGNNTNFRSVDSEQTAPTDNTTHSRPSKKVQNIPTTKIIEDIIRTLEKNVKKRKKIEQRKMKKRKEKSSRSLCMSEGSQSDHLQQSISSMDSKEQDSNRSVKSKGRDQLPNDLTRIVMPAENSNSKGRSNDQEAAAESDHEGLERKQRLKEKLAGSLERMEELIDQRISNRAERTYKIFERSDSDTLETICTLDSSEAAVTKSAPTTKSTMNERSPIGAPDNSGNISSRSPHSRKHSFLTRHPSQGSPHTPNASRSPTLHLESSRVSSKSEMTPSKSHTTSSSRVGLPEVYKTYKVRTKGLPLTSPTPYANKRNNSSWKSPIAKPDQRGDATPRGKQGSSSLESFLDDIQDLLLDDLYSIGTSLDDRSTCNYSVAMTVVQDHPLSSKVVGSSIATHDSEDDSDDMLTHYAWSSSSNPAAPHRRQARETFWDDYRKSRVPITERYCEMKIPKNKSEDKKLKPSCAHRQARNRGAQDELSMKRSLTR